MLLLCVCSKINCVCKVVSTLLITIPFLEGTKWYIKEHCLIHARNIRAEFVF